VAASVGVGVGVSAGAVTAAGMLGVVSPATTLMGRVVPGGSWAVR